MLDVLKTLSGLVSTRKGKSAKPVNIPKQIPAGTPIIPAKQVQEQPKAPQIPSIDMQAAVKIAEAKARELIVEAKDEAFKIRREAEEEARRKFEVIDRKEGALDERDKRLKTLEEQTEKRLTELEDIKQEQIAKLEKAAHMTRDEASSVILDAVKQQLREDIAKEIKEATIQAREEADAKAKEILVDCNEARGNGLCSGIYGFCH